MNPIIVSLQTFPHADIDTTFPSLVELHAEEPSDLRSPFDPAAIRHLTKISKGRLTNGASQRSLLEGSPFAFLRRLPKAVDVELECQDPSASDFNLEPFELLSLKRLCLDCAFDFWSMDELKAVLTFFPNLTELELKMRGLADYDEPVISKLC